jgi:hypothetical protein
MKRKAMLNRSLCNGGIESFVPIIYGKERKKVNQHNYDPGLFSSAG